jgi:D-alanyl-lipoteichoic acid acyltransferase DltB (MBOAT superfamily)
MSLSNWTRDYVFFPTLIKTKKVWVSTYASMLVIGIWHSASFNWILWAFLHASALNIYMLFRSTKIYKILVKNNISKTILAITGNITTITFVSTVFIIVALHEFKYTTEIITILIDKF